MEVNEMKTQILTALLVLAMMMGTGTVMAEDTASDDGDYVGEDFGWGDYTPQKGYLAPFSDEPPNGEDFGCHD